jgi:hypothetical protein
MSPNDLAAAWERGKSLELNDCEYSDVTPGV